MYIWLQVRLCFLKSQISFHFCKQNVMITHKQFLVFVSHMRCIKFLQNFPTNLHSIYSIHAVHRCDRSLICTYFLRRRVKLVVDVWTSITGTRYWIQVGLTLWWCGSWGGRRVLRIVYMTVKVIVYWFLQCHYRRAITPRLVAFKRFL